MELLNLEEFMKQTENKRLSKRLAEKIENELVRLYEVAGQGTYSLQAYLRSKNGKKLQGTKKKERHIFKYRLTAGDRLFYTYGKYVEGVPEEKKDSLVLLKYTIHDRQGREKKLAQGQEFAPVEETPGAGEAFTEEDLKLFGIQDTENTEEVEACIDRIFLAYSEKHKKFVAPVQKLLKAEKEGKNTGIKLSPDQEDILGKFLKNPCPTLILGGAGTGKTLLSLHLLNDYFSELDDTRCAYFTQSEALLNKAKNEYESISGKKPENNLYFYDINEFCIGLLEKLGQPVDRKKFVKTPIEVIKKAEAGMKKLDKVLKKMQEIEDRMDAKTAWLETLQKEEKRIEENRKKEKEAEALRKADKEENGNRKMDCMVQMIEALAMQQENRDIQLFTKEDYTANKTILELYNRFRHQLTGPVIVQNEIWKGDFCFAIDHISENGKIAVGLWFKNGEPKTEKNGYDCGEPVSSYKSFRIYSGPSYKKIAATFPYWKMLYLDEKQKESDSSLIQEASNVPPDWDEVELPFH